MPLGLSPEVVRDIAAGRGLSPEQVRKRFVTSAGVASVSTTATVYNQDLTATQAQASALIRDVAALRAATQAQGAAITRGAGKGIAASQAQAGAVVRSAGKTTSATQASSGALTRRGGKVTAAAQASSATLVRQAGRVLLGTQGSAATLARALGKTLVSTQGQTASITRSAGRALAAAQAQVATLPRSPGKAVTAMQGQGASLVRQAGRILTASQTQAASSIRQPGKLLVASQAQTASLVRQGGRILVASQAQTATLARGLALLRTLTATQAQSATLVRQAGRTLAATQGQSGVVVRQAGRWLAGTAASTASLLRGAPLSLAAASSASSSIARQVGKVLAPGYAGAVKADEPVEYLALDGDASATIGVSGTPSGGATFGDPGIPMGGTSATFDGVDGYVDLGDNFSFGAGQPFSVECWVKIADVPYESFASSYAVGLGGGWELYWGDDVLWFYLEGEEGSGEWLYSSSEADALAYDTWQHIIATFDGSNDAKLYLNGAHIADTDTVNSSGGGADIPNLPTGETHAQVGAGDYHGAEGGFVSGSMDEVAFYDYVLSPGQVAAHFAAGTAPSPVTVAPRPSLSKQPAKPLVGTQASTASLRRQSGRILSAMQASTATLERLAGKLLAAAQAQVATLTTSGLVTGKTLDATQATAGELAKQAARALETTQAQSAALTRQAGRLLAASQTSTATLDRLLSIARTLSATQTQAARLTKSATRTPTTSQTATAALIGARTFAQALNVSQATDAAIAYTRQMVALLVAAQASSATLERFAARTLRALQHAAATLSGHRLGPTRNKLPTTVLRPPSTTYIISPSSERHMLVANAAANAEPGPAQTMMVPPLVTTHAIAVDPSSRVSVNALTTRAILPARGGSLSAPRTGATATPRPPRTRIIVREPSDELSLTDPARTGLVASSEDELSVEPVDSRLSVG